MNRADVETTDMMSSLHIEVPMTPAEKAVADQIKYWRPVPEKNVMPNRWFKGKGSKYLTFTPDEGAFNNKRYGFEAVIIWAAITGRTLVMPPVHDYAFGDYFDLSDLARVVHVIPATEFFQRMELTQPGFLDDHTDVRNAIKSGTPLTKEQFR